MEYEWDDAKAAANLAKHGIDFLDAIGALIDPHRIEDIDDRTTMHGEGLCRIISARRAARHEQDRYYADAH